MSSFILYNVLFKMADRKNDIFASKMILDKEAVKRFIFFLISITRSIEIP